MTIFQFNPKDNVIVCVAEAIGPLKEYNLSMIVDTGASYSMIPKAVAKIIGLTGYYQSVEIATGTKIERVSKSSIPIFKAFGFEYRNMSVLIHDLPSQIKADGLLGLNFLKKSKATIDFSKNLIKIP